MTPSHTPTVRSAALDLLRAFGIRRIFGNPGSTELPLFLDFPGDFEYVLGLQESIVVAMADGHAGATRDAAFVNLHSAAGVGHAMGAIFTAMDRPRTFEYIDMPPDIAKAYQYDTCADMTKLRAAGCETPITPVEDAVRDYVVNYLATGVHLTPD